MANKRLVSKVTSIFMAGLARDTDAFAIPFQSEDDLTDREREICEAVLDELQDRATRMLKNYHTNNPLSIIEIVRHELAKK